MGCMSYEFGILRERGCRGMDGGKAGMLGLTGEVMFSRLVSILESRREL